MLIFRTSENNNTLPYDEHPIRVSSHMGFPIEKIAILDIETTGFNRSKDIISVVGIILFTSCGDCEIVQLFNDDGMSDYKIIESLPHLLEEIELLITYNGDGFDLPFLNHKAEFYGLDGLLLHKAPRYVQSLDLLKISRELFHYLPRKNLKAVEHELGISRLDNIDGKEAADSYIRYLKTGSEAERDKILLHNVEDILNLIPLLLKLHDKAMVQNPLSFPFSVTIEDKCILVVSCRIEKGLLSIRGREGHSNEDSSINAPQANIYSWLFEPLFLKKVKTLDYIHDNNQIIMKCKIIEAEPYYFINPFDDINEVMELKEDQLHTLVTRIHGEWTYDRIKLLSATLLRILLDT